MENKKVIKVRRDEIGHGEEKYMNGKASYRRVFNEFISDAILCNNIVSIDYDFIYNQETGFYSYDELYEEKLEELKEEYKDKIIDGLGMTSEQIQGGFKTLEELEQEAEEYAEEEQYNYEFYQYFIIDFKYGFLLDMLKEMKQHTLQIMYSDVLDCYILGVSHFGTAWDYVSSDFDLEIIEE